MSDKHNEPVTVRLPKVLLDALDQFRREKDVIPTRPEAIRQIMNDWMTNQGYLLFEEDDEGE